MTTPSEPTPPPAENQPTGAPADAQQLGPDTEPTIADGPAPRRLERSSSDRIIGGVCGGIGSHFGIDPTLVRIGAVALALLGGAGFVIYGAALLLVPLDDGAPGPATPSDRRTAIALAAGLIIVGLVVGSTGIVGGVFVPIGFVLLAGLGAWWFASGERPSGEPKHVLRKAAQGVALLIGCGALAAGSFLASGLGGSAVVAGLVIVAGAGLVAGAFVGGARWLILPALAVALPLAFVSAAGIDLKGGFGDREVRPQSLSEIDSSYRIGAGQLVVDLRDVKLTPGDRRLKLNVGAGHALVIVAPNVCVASAADVGVGAVAIFNRVGGGIDVAWKDSRKAAANVPRLIIDADLGAGFLEVRHDRLNTQPHHHGNDDPGRNAACAATSA